jgi:hypothetical protein
MSDIVNDDDLSALAAEYAIGTLDPDERTRANVLLEVDEGFRALVQAWERRLGELHLMVEPVEPDGRIWERIRGRLGIRAPDTPPPFAPAPPQSVPPPFRGPAAEPVRAPAAEPKFEPRQPFEPRFESRFELPPAPQLHSVQETMQETAEETPQETVTPEASTFGASTLGAPMFGAPAPEALTPEQQLAGLIREADRFSAPRVAETTTVARDTIAAEPQVEAATASQAHASVTTETDALLAEAAEAITHKPVKAVGPDQVEAVAPGPMIAANGESWPSRESAPRRESMLAPADVTRVAFKAQERRLETWRAAMLFMSVVALGLGSLIAAWRYAPEHLPPRLQPNAVLGFQDLGPSERIPAPHGTQFEE